MALVITVIILLILAGISIAQLTGSGLFEKAKLEEEKSEEAQKLENSTLSKYEEELEKQIKGSNREETKLLQQKVLWTGSMSSGEMVLTDSIYNYNFLIFYSDSMSANVYVDKSGMNKINSGSVWAWTDSINGTSVWGFYISEISNDGKTLKLVRSGQASVTSSWEATMNITKIIGI